MEQRKLYNQTDTDGNNIYFYWDTVPGANKFLLEGLTPCLQYEILKTTDKTSCLIPRSICDKYTAFRLKYKLENYENNSFITSDITKLSNNSSVLILQPINIHITRSYHGLSLCFETSDLYDEFCLYEITEGKKQQILSSNVCIINTVSLKEQSHYCVEAFKRNNETSVLMAKSDIFTCRPDIRSQNRTPFLSIIIPVYNAELYLARTLDSVLMSTYKNIEIILVDDESTDKSPEICDWYAEHYQQIQVLHIPHGDNCKARNTGANLAGGKYIAFLDSDDIVHPYMYQRLIEAAETNNSKIAISQVSIISYHEKNNTYEVEQKCCMFSGIEKEFKNNFLIKSYKEMLESNGDPSNIYFCAVWNKIIRTDIARKVKFNEDSPFFEDDAYTMSLYSYIDKFVFVDNAYYIWDKRRHVLFNSKTVNYRKIPYYDNWKYWIMARGYVLFTGNKENRIAGIYRSCVMKKLLQTFGNSVPQNALDRLFIAMIKYYVRMANLPVEELEKYRDPQYYAKWRIIENSEIHEYDGTGKIPDDILSD